MGRPAKPAIKEPDLQGFKHFKLLLPLLQQLHDSGCARDRAGNRKLHYDQYVSLILLYFFNPIVTSLRGIQQSSQLKKVQRLLDCPRASLGSLSEAASVFDPELLLGIIGDLADRLGPIHPNPQLSDFKKVITLVDGSFLRAAPRVIEAMLRLKSKPKGFTLHTHFELLKGSPTRIDVTPANVSERKVLSEALESDRLYVMDRGYHRFELFQRIIEHQSSFVCRIRDNTVFTPETVLSAPTGKELAGEVVYDAIVQFSSDQARLAGLTRSMRVVKVKSNPHRKPSGKNGRGGPEQGDTILLATGMLDVPGDVIALLYRHRWSIETFFRFFKHILGCRHLISQSMDGITIQTYTAIIACLLIALWTGKKPTLRTYEMICFYFIGLADLEELLEHIDKLQPAP